MQQSPALTAASALRTPSVMNSGTLGSANRCRIAGGTSIAMRLPAGNSYFAGLPFRIRGSSGRW
jgi:hypothetical protein